MKYGSADPTHVNRGGTFTNPLYSVFNNMLARCYNPNGENYKYYGARGIKVCDRWRGENGFQFFIQDMGTRPKGYQLDRKDVNGDYSPENCRWVNKYEQMANTRAAGDVPGVTWNPKLSKFRVRIKVNGKEISLGHHADFLDACNARWAAERKYV